MNKLTQLIISVVFFAAAVPAAAQTYVNPGLKFGYRFGDTGGFILGFDLSVIVAGDKHYYGFVLAGDGTSSIADIHLGMEFGSGLFGIAIGPVLRIKPDSGEFGFRITPYAGFILVPYCNYQFLAPNHGEHEVGTYLKFTIPGSYTKPDRIGW
jgi:hypothetical protein